MQLDLEDLGVYESLWLKFSPYKGWRDYNANNPLQSDAYWKTTSHLGHDGKLEITNYVCLGFKKHIVKGTLGGMKSHWLPCFISTYSTTMHVTLYD
jgi:hypothetical protein